MMKVFTRLTSASDFLKLGFLPGLARDSKNVNPALFADNLAKLTYWKFRNSLRKISKQKTQKAFLKMSKKCQKTTSG
jgi:hypothetical protein